MDEQDLSGSLAQLQFSDTLSLAAVSKLATVVRPGDFAPGSVLFTEGEIHPWLYLILAGEVALEMCVPARGCTRILSVGPGDLLAWSAVLGDGRMTATAIALSPLRTLIAASDQVQSLCESDRAFGYEFMRQMARALSKRLVATRLQLLDLYQGSSSERFAVSPLE
jgi:CRP-like cAMP-binding protein